MHSSAVNSTRHCSSRVRLEAGHSMHTAQPLRCAGSICATPPLLSPAHSGRQRWHDITTLYAPKNTCASGRSLMKSPLSTSGSKISSPCTQWWQRVLLWLRGTLLNPTKYFNVCGSGESNTLRSMPLTMTSADNTYDILVFSEPETETRWKFDAERSHYNWGIA